jgi:Zn-dependent membrane protease YugP
MIYILCLIIPLILGLYAQHKVKSTFDRYSKLNTSSGMSGASVARAILDAAQIRDVEVKEISDYLGDHYDPINKRLCLSPVVYNSNSIAAAGVAAHEVGHAIQHDAAYAPLKFRMMIVPVTQISSQILPFLIIGGFLFHMTSLITLGIICYLVLTLFQLITLPVEFDASKRAKVILGQMGFVQGPQETQGVAAVLNAAALTYVAAFVAALGNLVYLLLIRNQNQH